MTGKSSYHIKVNIHRGPTMTDNLPIPIPTTLKKISGSMPFSDTPHHLHYLTQTYCEVMLVFQRKLDTAHFSIFSLYRGWAGIA